MILLLAQSHCWVVIAHVLVWCLAYWSSSCPAFLAKWYRVSWRGKTSSGDLILQRGGSPSSPLDYEYHLFVLSSRGLSGQKPLFTPREGRTELRLVTISGSDSSKSTEEVEPKLQVLCFYRCAASPTVCVFKKASKVCRPSFRFNFEHKATSPRVESGSPLKLPALLLWWV